MKCKHCGKGISLRKGNWVHHIENRTSYGAACPAQGLIAWVDGFLKKAEPDTFLLYLSELESKSPSEPS